MSERERLRRWRLVLGGQADEDGDKLSYEDRAVDAASRIRDAEPYAAENVWAAACLARAKGRLGAPSLAEAVDGFERIGARFERACTLLLIPERADEGRAELGLLGCPPPAG